MTYGRCATREQLEELRKEHNVPVANAMLDSGFKAAEVYRFSLATGWKAFKGDDAEDFLHKDPATSRSIRRIWQRTFVDPFFGSRQARRSKPLPSFRWSNNATKDLLAEYMMGLVGDWTLPAQIGRDYLKQVTAERREEKQDDSRPHSLFLETGPPRQPPARLRADDYCRRRHYETNYGKGTISFLRAS